MKEYMKIDIKKIIALMVILLSAFIFFNNHVSALSGSQFNPSRIIDDSVFYNSSTMSSDQIQAFLNAKLPSCDTSGSRMYTSTLTRAQWAASNGKPEPPYVCLKDYEQNTPTMDSASGLCNAISGGSKSAAQIIHDVAIACKINPQVLIVLLQKEQSLITDDWPWPIQYNKATGFSCPDTAPCDPAYAGFFYQVYYAARQFKVYAKYPDNYNYKAYRNNYIYYHPSLSACGGSTIYIENQATASLYIYTPYQPNQAALNNLYGTGDGCSAYGNRNFWRMFTDWFGSTTSTSPLRYIECDDQKYLIERFIKTKRLVTQDGVEHFGLDDRYFVPDDPGCNYPTYSVPLDITIRSRDTGKLYLVDQNNRFHVYNQTISDAWGIGSLEDKSNDPQFDGDSIQNLTFNKGPLTNIVTSTNSNVSTDYVISSNQRYAIEGTESNDNSKSLLINGKNIEPAIMTVDLLQKITSGGSISSSFRVGSDWYLFNAGSAVKIKSSETTNWSNLLTGPTVGPDILSFYKPILTINDSYRTDKFYYRHNNGSLFKTPDVEVAKNLGIETNKELSYNLAKHIQDERTGLEYKTHLKGNIRIIECSGNEYIVERFIRVKRLITDAAIQEWGFAGKHFAINDIGCDYPSYSLQLDQVIRSRNTGSVYYIDSGNAVLINSSQLEADYSLGDTSLQAYPMLEPLSILDNLKIIR